MQTTFKLAERSLLINQFAEDFLIEENVHSIKYIKYCITKNDIANAMTSRGCCDRW